MATETESLTIEATGTKARIARVYAESLLSLAAKNNEQDAVGEELRTVAEVMVKNPRIAVAFANPAISSKDRLAFLAKAFEHNTSTLFKKFLGVLNAKGRLSNLPAISSAFLAIRDTQAGRVRVIVRAAVPLSGEQEQRLKNTLAQKLNKQPILNVRIEPELLGGLIVQIGDRVYDSSVRTRLNNLRNHLLASGSHV
jgi:F-type H+-transporting ATPase subunit delta